MNSETHPFQVSVWVPGEEVALCLSFCHQDGVRVAELSSDGQRWQYYKYLPEAARELK